MNKAKLRKKRVEKKFKDLHPLDLLNLKEEGRIKIKQVLLRESTFMILDDIRSSDAQLKDINDVIDTLLHIASLVLQTEQREQDRLREETNH